MILVKTWIIEVLETPFFRLTKIILEEKMAFFQIFLQNWYVSTIFKKKYYIFIYVENLCHFNPVLGVHDQRQC